MAIEYAPEPHIATTSGDYETLKTCVALFAETRHPVSESTIRRWIIEHQLDTKKRLVRGKYKTFVPYQMLLPIHRDWVAAAQAAHD